MKVAVLACGPSLVKHYDTREAFDLVIAVNSAGWLYACDWMAFTDKHILAGDHVRPRAGYLTNKGWRTKVEALGLRWEPLPIYDYRLKNLTPAMAELCIGQGMTECGFTFPNALFFAGKHGATDLHVFGFDCSMTEEDVAGVKGYHTRKRWATELPWIREVLKPIERVTLRCDAADNVKRWVLGKVGCTVYSLFPVESET